MTLDTHLMKGRQKVKKKKKTPPFLYSLCNYCMTHIMGCIFHSDNTLQSSLLSWCHRLRARMTTTPLPRSKPAALFVIHLYTSIHLREQRLYEKCRLVTGSDRPESVEGFFFFFPPACGVFNMEIGFEPHLHRSAHLWAKLCYCWQGKWTINSS